MSEKLLPCPFCGGEPEFVGSTAFNGCMATVKCKCGASITARESEMWLTSDGKGYKADVRAVITWNKREN